MNIGLKRKANLKPKALRQYKTDGNLSNLSHGNVDRNGDNINPVVPPNYITYEALYNECLGNEQIPHITESEKKTLIAKFEKDSRYIDFYNKSIGVQILLNDALYELERVKWWCDWCKIMRAKQLTRRQQKDELEIQRDELEIQRDELEIQRLYSILIPIRNGLLSLMRKHKQYTAEDFVDLATRIIYDTNDVFDANEKTKQQAQTGGNNSDFIIAKDKLIKEIMKINNNTKGAFIELVIQKEYILNLAKNCLKMRNVKSKTTANKKEHLKQKTINYEKRRMVERLVSDEDVKNAVYAKQQQLVELSPQAAFHKQQQLVALSRQAGLDALRLRAKTNAYPRRQKQLKEKLAHHEGYRQGLQLQARMRHAQAAQEAYMRQAQEAQEAQMRQAQAEAQGTSGSTSTDRTYKY